jgi:hypothetical protein
VSVARWFSGRIGAATSTRRSRRPLAVLVAACCFGLIAVTGAGAETSIRQAFWLTESQQARLRALVAADPEAGALWRTLRAEAEALHARRPSPLPVIHYEGLLDTDPRRVATIAALGDMDALVVLTQAAAIDPAGPYAASATRLVLAWVDTYVPTGNTINENTLEPLACAYGTLAGRFAGGERERIDRFLRALAEAQVRVSERADRPGVPKDNWTSKRVKLVGLIGLVLRDERFVDYARRMHRLYLEDALFPDGSSHDLHVRDALSYHVSSIQPLVVLAIYAREGRLPGGEDLFRLEAPSGASLARSTRFVVPYADGSRTREEWRHTMVELDRRRAAAGLSRYTPGRPFDPSRALELLEAASHFEQSYVPLVAALTGSAAERHPTWTTMLREVMIAGEPGTRE